MSDTSASAGTFEERGDAGKGAPGVVKFWMDAIALASDEEDDWRKDAEETESIYSGGRDGNAKNRRRFNILYSNTETLSAAVYNSAPVPDVRQRYPDNPEQQQPPMPGQPPAAMMPHPARDAARVIERCLNYSLDEYDVDATFRTVAQNGLVAGRGLIRVRYKPMADDTGIAYQSVVCEPVDWRTFRRGPATRWADVQWIAFRHYLTRDELKKLNPEVGTTLNLDYALPKSDTDKGDGKNTSDVFKRGEVWEIWDKERREVVFIAPSHTLGPILTVRDPLGLIDFFPVPRPFQPMDVSGSIIPVEPYRLYSGLADELEMLTRRIRALTAAIKWRGAYIDPQMGDFLSKFEKLDDGDMAPVDNPAAMTAGLDKAFWFQPTEQAAKVLMQLYEARDQVKQSIYEVTGISDLLRGSSVASETATAQGIKAQWGSLRVSVMQAEMQRIARDVIRMKTEIIAEKFEPATLQSMSGMELTPDVLALLKNDVLRRYRVDVETDSTIRADLQRQQQNVSGFVQGFGQFIQSVGPAVQAGALPMPVVAEMVKSFSRVFKLGRAVEEALDNMPSQAPPQADPAAAQQAEAQAAQQAEAAKMQAEQAKMQAQMQMKQMEIEAQTQRDGAKLQAETALKRAEMEAEQQRHAAEMALKQAELQMRAAEIDHRAEHEGRRFGLDERVAQASASATGAELRPEGAPTMHDIMGQMAEQQGALVQAVQQQTMANQQLVAGITEAMRVSAGPKRIVRDKNNRAIGVEPVGMN
jgi:hypothetical protein